VSEGSAQASQKLTALFGKFALVGVLNTLVHALTTVALVELVQLHPVPASVAGFLLAVAVSFVLNTFWTFRQSDNLQQRFVRFIVVSVTAMLLNTLIMYLAVNVFSLHYLLGLLMVLFVVPVYNFTLNLKWSYRVD
jgi:putative flippase GtrA